MARRYSEKFKARMVGRLSGPNAVSASQLAKEVGVGQPTLSTWLRAARTLRSNVKKKADSPEKAPARRPEDWTADEKVAAVFEAVALGEDELGEFLRRKGLHEADLTAWKSEVLNSGRAALAGRGTGKRAKKSQTRVQTTRELQKQVRALKKELERKDKALAEAAALLVLKKKVREIFGDEDDELPGKNER